MLYHILLSRYILKNKAFAMNNKFKQMYFSEKADTMVHQVSWNLCYEATSKYSKIWLWCINIRVSHTAGHFWAHHYHLPDILLMSKISVWCSQESRWWVHKLNFMFLLSCPFLGRVVVFVIFLYCQNRKHSIKASGFASACSSKHTHIDVFFLPIPPLQRRKMNPPVCHSPQQKQSVSCFLHMDKGIQIVIQMCGPSCTYLLSHRLHSKESLSSLSPYNSILMYCKSPT